MRTPFIPMAMLAVLLIAASCSHNPMSGYEGLEHRGERLTSEIQDLKADTIYCPASMTSMSGQWILRDSEFIFLDEYTVGIKHFALDGRFLGEAVTKGRGPGEVIGNPLVSTWDPVRQVLFVHDSNCDFQAFSRNDSLLLNMNEPWFMLMDEHYDLALIKHRLQKPDLSEPQIYDYNFECNRLCSYQNAVYLPVIAEHPKLNGYEKGNGAKRYWREAKIIASFDLDSIARTKKILGSYPPAYYNKNIPVFATYDFFVKDGQIHVAFAADPKIYVMDTEGNYLFSYGEAVPGISLDFPRTTTFEEYESVFDDMRLRHGHYCRLCDLGGYVLRTCFTDAKGWLLQVYDGNDLVKEYNCEEELEPFGYSDGYFYASIKADYKTERFRIIRFRI